MSDCLRCGAKRADGNGIVCMKCHGRAQGDAGVAPTPDLPLVRKLAFAVIALGQLERAIQGPVPVIFPTQRAEGLGDLLIDTGEALMASEPQPVYDPMAKPHREQFLDLVRGAAKELVASAPQRPRLVTANGSPAKLRG